MHYFGPWADPQAALDAYLDQKNDLLAGRTPSRGIRTVKTLADAFLTSRKRLVGSREWTERTWETYDHRLFCHVSRSPTSLVLRSIEVLLSILLDDALNYDGLAMMAGREKADLMGSYMLTSSVKWLPQNNR